MFALLVLADGTTNGGTRILLLVLLTVAILLILTGAIIAVITMYFYWKARSGNAHSMSDADALPGE
jgi:hypothetical protein